MFGMRVGFILYCNSLSHYIFSFFTHSPAKSGGRECQTEDWKLHKTICKQHQQTQQEKIELKINEQLSNLTLHNDDGDSESSDDQCSIDRDQSNHEDDSDIIEIDNMQSIAFSDIEADDGYVIISATPTL